MIKFLLLFCPIIFFSQHISLDSTLISIDLKNDEKLYEDISHDLCSLSLEDSDTPKNKTFKFYIWEVIKCKKNDNYFLSGYYAGKPYFVATEKNSAIEVDSKLVTIEKLYVDINELSEMKKIILKSLAFKNSGSISDLKFNNASDIEFMIKKYGKNLGEKIYFIELEPGMKMSMMFDAMDKSYIERVSHTEHKDRQGDWDVYMYKSGSKTFYSVTLLNFKIVNFSKTDL